MSLKSAQGIVLDRAERLAYDSTGKKHRKATAYHDAKCDGCGTRRRDCVGKCCGDCWHPHPQSVHETRSHALSNHDAFEKADDGVVREARMQRAFAALTDEERECLRLHEKVVGIREVKTTVLPSALDDAFAAGWHKTGHVGRDGRIEIVKNFPGKLSYEQIGELLGLSIEAVRWRIVKAHRKLQDALRGSL